MNWSIDYSPLPVYIRVTTDGTASLEDTTAMWDEILASEFWKPGTSLLFDSGAVRRLGPGGYRLTQETAHYFISKNAEIGESNIAVFRGHEEIYRFSSQFQYAVRMRGSAVIIRNFSNEQTAVDWLSIIAHEDSEPPMTQTAGSDA